MSKIVSLSLDDATLSDLDQAQKEMGFAGRSEAVRTAIQRLIQERKERSSLKGTIDAVLILVHKEKHDEAISNIKHRYLHIIKTQLHNHLENHKCLETFVLNGPARDITRLTEELQTSRKAEQVRLILS